MPKVCLYLQVHQPYRIGKYTYRNVGSSISYFDSQVNREILRRVAHKSYIPTARMLKNLANSLGNSFRLALSFSGVVVEQMQEWAPEALYAFQELIATGNVELLGETYYHSLSSVFDRSSFEEEVALHSEMLRSVFAYAPRVFRNTELIYSDEIGKCVSELGFKGILAEGPVGSAEVDAQPRVVQHPECNLKVLMRDRRLSDEIAFRFTAGKSGSGPLTAEDFIEELSNAYDPGEAACLFLDFETFGEHHWEHTGIFDFFEQMCGSLVREKQGQFVSPSDLLRDLVIIPKRSVKEIRSWADSEHDLSAWSGNTMQQKAIAKIMRLAACGKGNCCAPLELLNDIRKLQTSDHFYYMSTKGAADGIVHQYFSPFESPYDAFIHYMNILKDVEFRIENVMDRVANL